MIECTGKMEAFAEGMSMLAAGGRYLILGIFSGHGTVPLDPVRLNNRSQSVIGSLGVLDRERLRHHHSDRPAAR